MKGRRLVHYLLIIPELAEIDSHLEGKRKVERTLPQSIVIGPFYVNTDSVRLALAKKHKEIARALLDYLVEQLRKDTEQVQCMNVVFRINDFSCLVAYA